jgi:hypothetical protein
MNDDPMNDDPMNAFGPNKNDDQDDFDPMNDGGMNGEGMNDGMNDIPETTQN